MNARRLAAVKFMSAKQKLKHGNDFPLAIIREATPARGSAITPERQGAYATIAAACFNGPIPAGHRAWLDAQTEEFVVTMADRLHSPNDQAGSGRIKTMNTEGLIKELKTWCEEAGSQKLAAATLGVSPQYLGDVLKGRREPGKSILKTMGFQKVVTFRRLWPAAYSSATKRNSANDESERRP